MVRGRALAEADRVRCLELRVLGLTYGAIHTKTGIAKSTIVTTLRRGRAAKKNGRAMILGRADADAIRKWLDDSETAKPNWAEVVSKVRVRLGKVVCEQTIKRALVRFPPTDRCVVRTSG